MSEERTEEYHRIGTLRSVSFIIDRIH